MTSDERAAEIATLVDRVAAIFEGQNNRLMLQAVAAYLIAVLPQDESRVSVIMKLGGMINTGELGDGVTVELRRYDA